MTQKILIVDDTPANLVVVEKELRVISDIEVIMANSGNEALTATIDNDFSLAIIDVQMPEMDGYELAKILREDEKTANLLIIFLSAAYSDDIHIFEGYESGAVDFMTKPFKPEILLGKVQTFLKLDLHIRNLEDIVKIKTIKLSNTLKEWRQTFDAVHDYVCIIDIEHNIQIANKSMLETFGENIIGKKCYQIFHCTENLLPDCPALQMMKDGCFHQEIIFEKDKKRGKYFDVSVFPIKNESAEIDKYVHVVRDITEQKNIDKQLRHGEKMQAIGQLAGGVAHDFNNQLTAILGYATLLRDKVEDDEILTKFANIIIAATNRSADLTQKLLAFARKGVFKKTDNDIHTLMKETIVLIDRTINKKVKLDLKLDAIGSIVHCDASQIENAFLNLLINAKDAMPDGGTITVSTENAFVTPENTEDEIQLTPGKYIVIKIRDTGTGIPDEVLAHIFEPFFSTKDNKGTGLGLAAVYGTITGHQGSIDVFSKEGEGTEFTIKLLLSKKDTQVGEETLFAIEDAKDTHLKSALIMLVDDEEMVNAYMEEVVTTLGYDVISCSNGKKAVEVYKEKWKDIDLVFLDMIMPEMNGRQAYEKMKKINPEIKVVFLSGYSENHIQDFLDNDAVWLVNKPFGLKTISDMLKRALV